MLGPLLEVEMLKKCTLLWREAHFEVKSVTDGLGPLLDAQISFRVARGQGIVHPAKSEQSVRVLWDFENDGRRGTFQEDPQGCMSRGRGNTRDMFIRDVRRSGH